MKTVLSDLKFSDKTLLVSPHQPPDSPFYHPLVEEFHVRGTVYGIYTVYIIPIYSLHFAMLSCGRRDGLRVRGFFPKHKTL